MIERRDPLGPPKCHADEEDGATDGGVVVVVVGGGVVGVHGLRLHETTEREHAQMTQMSPHQMTHQLRGDVRGQRSATTRRQREICGQRFFLPCRL